MTKEQRRDTIDSFIDAAREIEQAARTMSSTLGFIKNEMNQKDREPGLAELHVEAARYAARVKKAEDELIVARTRIKTLEARIRELTASRDVSSISSETALGLPLEAQL